MKVEFAKYHGLGNDFIIVDNRNGCYDDVMRSPYMRRAFCCRKTGIGADGILEMKQSCSATAGCEVRLVYFNADGEEGSFCGNGGRCFVEFAIRKGVPLIDGCLVFEAFDGVHKGRRCRCDNYIELEMNDVTGIKEYENGDYFVNTGSPHHVRFVTNVKQCDVRQLGREIAWGKLYRAKGCNVNFVQETDAGGFVRTYERGVENETLACGTGITAVALVLHKRRHGTTAHGTFSDVISCSGGSAEVSFATDDGCVFYNVRLMGPVCHVFDGVIIHST
ncbi:diaminopimelate epimerase-like [Liolophura sinensis]|uniref:diaminopimelate epimerase-like n=1 Tax=Liolophura sinensis TaxID=3198878 RepID=UPI003158FF25